jgi:MFS family permease
LVTDKATWRWCFYINLPLGALSVVGLTIFFNNPVHLATNKTVKERLMEFDYIGPTLFLPAITCLLLAFEWGGSKYPWNGPVIISLFIGFGLILPFWVYSQIRLGDNATIPPRLLLQRTVLLPSLFSACASAAYFIVQFYLPLYFQAIRNTTATASAINILPFILSTIVMSVVSGVLLSKVGYYTPFMIVGASALAIGCGLFSTMGLRTDLGHWISFEIIAGIGMGLLMQVFSTGMMISDQ